MTSYNSGQILSPSQSASRQRWLAAGLFLLALLGPLATGWLLLAGCDPAAMIGGYGRFFIGLASGLSFAILGTLIFVYRPHNRIGWLCLATGVGLLYGGVIDFYVPCGLAGTIKAPGLQYAIWYNYSYGIFNLLPMFILVPMVYPTGRFLSPRWRWITVSGIILALVGGTAMGLLPDFSLDNGFEYSYPVASPFGLSSLPAWWYPLFRTVAVVSFNLLILAAIVAMFIRFKRSAGDERQQMKWLAYFLITAVGVQMLIFELPAAFLYPQIVKTPWYYLVTAVVFGGFPIVIGIAIFKHRLYAIDVVINRTLVYGGLTLVVILIYTLTVGGLGLLFQTSGNLVISLIATGLIAVAFHPVRERLQRGVNRLMFGQRDEPYAVLSQLSQQLQTTAVPRETLTSIVETIAATLKLPYVAIELVDQDAQVGYASVGEPVGETAELPLRYQNEPVGRLIVSPRAPGEKFTAREEQLLTDIAAQAGSAASATRLALALQRSREKLVLAREEERRRIRRDLHDGLGPTMASQTLKLDSVLDLLAENDIRTAEGHVKELKNQTQQMVADIRRLVYELRPPALDELGLLEALRAHVAQMGEANRGLYISIEAWPEPLPPLPAAIEVAAYRIALEGVTNVIRHAQARNCRIRFAISEDEQPLRLVLTVTDDGRGLPAQFQAGVGLISMRERAEELGGTFAVGSNQGKGTRIIAALPFAAEG